MPKNKKVSKNDIVESEKQSEQEAESMSQHSSEASVDEVENAPDEEAEKALAVEEGAGDTESIPAEVAAIHTDNESATALNKKSTSSKKDESKKKSKRSKAYLASKEQIEQGKLYKLEEAIELVKKVSHAKFDASIEIHLKLATKKGKTQSESPKGIFHLPHGTGKSKNIVVLDEKMIEEIAKTKKLNFDIALVTPEMMTKVVKVAKILGPKGKMPDPKSGTVTTDPQKTIEEINNGKVEYRIDPNNNVHQIIGKVSWENQKLLENSKVVLSGFPKSRLEAAYLSASISPSVALDLKAIL